MLYQLWWRKKKADFIIPPTYFRRNDFSIKEVVNQQPQNENSNPPEVTIPEVEIKEEPKVIPEVQSVTPIENPPTQKSTDSNEPKVSALSLASIRAKKELLEQQKGIVKHDVQLPAEHFSETDMLQFWFKYADRLGDKGHKIMESLLRMNEPKLEGFKIVYELPNEGSKIDFEKEKPELLGYLRGHLHNHEITIDVIVNEGIKSKIAFTSQDKYNRLNEINPNVELLKKTFDLDI